MDEARAVAGPSGVFATSLRPASRRAVSAGRSLARRARRRRAHAPPGPCDPYRAGGDTRFVEFIDDAATRLGRLIDAAAGSHAEGQGYLTARGYFGALTAFVLLQKQLGMDTIHPVDPADYTRHLAQVTARGTAPAGPSMTRNRGPLLLGAGVPTVPCQPSAE